MPELPEIEILCQGLARYLPGKTISSVEIRVPKLFLGPKARLIGSKINGVRRRAKVLLLDGGNGLTLLVHLKMTGQLVLQSKDQKLLVVGGHPQASYSQPLPHTHSHIIFSFDDGSKLFFNDLRKFGWIHVVPKEKSDSHGMLARVGPEPFNIVSVAEFRLRLEKYPNRKIFQALLDQELIAGIGNIYANEILYEAKITPGRRVKDIPASQWLWLYRAVRHVLTTAIRRGGTSSFVGVNGARGDYLNFAHVYHQKVGRPCGHAVTHQKISGRTAYFCPICQH